MLALTVDAYREKKALNMTDKEIMSEYNMNHSALIKFKRENDLLNRFRVMHERNVQNKHAEQESEQTYMVDDIPYNTEETALDPSSEGEYIKNIDLLNKALRLAEATIEELKAKDEKNTELIKQSHADIDRLKNRIVELHERQSVKTTDETEDVNYKLMMEGIVLAWAQTIVDKTN